MLIKRLKTSGQVKWGDLVLNPGIRTWTEVDGKKSSAKPGPIATKSSWGFKTKPAGADTYFKLYFEGYLYFPRTEETRLLAGTSGTSIMVMVNGKRALYGSGDTEAPVQLLKGYNSVRGYIRVSVNKLGNKDKHPWGFISFTEQNGQSIDIPSELWFHDVTK